MGGCNEPKLLRDMSSEAYTSIKTVQNGMPDDEPWRVFTIPHGLLYHLQVQVASKYAWLIRSILLQL